MSEVRQDKTTGEWVIISPGRGRRPSDFSARRRTPGQTLGLDPACPFCPGNEAQLPGILAETPANEPPGWRVRVVQNKYPAMQSNASAVSSDSQHTSVSGYGQHEVVIDTPRHDLDLPSMSDAERDAVVSMYLARYRHLIGDAQVKSVILFRNHDGASGASLRHPHAQLVALGVIPPRLQSMSIWAHQRYDATKRCTTCEEIVLERTDGRRLVEETRSFLALVPFAATVPCETWLVPKRHQASFATMEESECADLSMLLGRTLRRLKALYRDLPYNFVVDSAASSEQQDVALHWRLRITPNLVTWGGFERGTDMPINPSLPEQDAALLRAVTGPGESRTISAG